MNKTEPAADRIHAGYTLEEGVLARVREWTDVFGWLRLGRVLRLAGSPVALAIVAGTLALWNTGIRFAWEKLSVKPVPATLALPADPNRTLMGDSMLVPLIDIAQVFPVAMPVSWFALAESRSSFLSLVALTMWTWVIWTPTVLMLLRQGAMLTAGRNLVGLKAVTHMALRRTPYAWFLACMPLACALAIGLLMLGLGYTGRLFGGIDWIELLLAVPMALISVLAGILIFGAYIAVPLGWAALVNEPDPDPLDSLSRGYEYLYRRSLRTVMYGAIIIVPLWVVAFLSHGIAAAASHFCRGMLAVTGGSESLVNQVVHLLSCLPMVVIITVLTGFIGGVYLLLRSDAGGQEVEDIWVPPAPSRPRLPTLPGVDLG